jgi:hypothetical protein
MLNRGGSRRQICQPFVALLCSTLFLSLSLGCGEVTDPVPDGQTHILKQGFRNTNPTFAPPSLWDRLTYLPSRTWVTTVHARTVNLPRVENDGSALKNNRTDATVTWVSHSTVLIQLGGVNILTDPNWSDRASPVTFAGPKRLMPPGVPLEQLPPIDLVLISHQVHELFLAGDDRSLIEYELLGRDAMLSVPTPDHYLPFLYVIALRHKGEQMNFPVEGVDGGSISMLTVQIG